MANKPTSPHLTTHNHGNWHLLLSKINNKIGVCKLWLQCFVVFFTISSLGNSAEAIYSLALHNNISVNNAPYIQLWTHKIIMKLKISNGLVM